MMQHNFESAIALKAWHAQDARCKTAQHLLPLSRVLNIWKKSMPFIEEFLLDLSKTTLKLQWLGCGNAEPVGGVFDGEVCIRKIDSCREKQRAPLARSAIRSENANFLPELEQSCIVAYAFLPLNAAILTGATGWHRGAAGCQLATAVAPTRRWLVALRPWLPWQFLR